MGAQFDIDGVSIVKVSGIVTCEDILIDDVGEENFADVAVVEGTVGGISIVKIGEMVNGANVFLDSVDEDDGVTAGIAISEIVFAPGATAS